MPPDPPTGYRLWRTFIRTPLVKSWIRPSRNNIIIKRLRTNRQDGCHFFVIILCICSNWLLDFSRTYHVQDLQRFLLIFEFKIVIKLLIAPLCRANKQWVSIRNKDNWSMTWINEEGRPVSFLEMQLRSWPGSNNRPLSYMVAYLVLLCIYVNKIHWPHFRSSIPSNFAHGSGVRKAY